LSVYCITSRKEIVMPWSVGDVERFKKGLSDAQKRRWVRIANDALRRCRARGGTNCDAAAIRQANGVVGNKAKDMENVIEAAFGIYAATTSDYTIREEMYHGRKHIVVPVVMMVEGVHNGSAGPIMHTEDNLRQNVQSWNGRPVTIGHPEDEGGNVSANSPTVMDEWTVGQIFNAHYDNGLKAEAWIDLEEIQRKSPTALTYIRQGRPLEVSVGIFNNTEAVEGEWHGETYEAIAIDYQPDHLALLPGEQGACSWEDGCGIRVNKEGGTMEKFIETLKDLSKDGYAVSLVTNEQGYREIAQTLQTKLDGLDNDIKVHFLTEVFDDYFVYEVRNRERGDSTLYKRDYTVVNNSVEFGDADPVEVRRSVEYVTFSMRRNPPNTNNKNEKSMACCEGKVENLIANKLTRYTPEDKEWLMTLSEEQIDKLEPVEVKPEKKEEAPQVNKDQVISDFKESLKTIEDYTELMPDEMKEKVSAGVGLYKEHREELIESILTNTEKDTWDKEGLEAMDTKTLEKVAKSVTPHDYSGHGGQTRQKAKIAPYVPVQFGKKSQKKED